MAELHLNISDDVLNELKRKLNPDPPRNRFERFLDWIGVRRRLSNKRVLEEMLTILNWSTNDAEQGRLIISANPDGTDVTRLAMKSLEHARTRATMPKN